MYGPESLVFSDRLFFVIGIAIVCGAFLGAVYDIFRIARIASSRDDSIRKSKSTDVRKRKRRLPERITEYILLFLEDLVFSLIVAFSVILFIYKFNGGISRFYILFSIGLGFLLYHLTLGKLVIKCSTAIIHFVKTLLLFVFNATVTPIKRFARFLSGIIKNKISKKRTEIFTARIIKKRLDTPV